MRARSIRTLVCISIGITLLALAAMDASAAGCKAEVNSKLRGQESRDDFEEYRFWVEVRSPERCAKVYFKMITVERRPNGEEITKTQDMTKKVRDSESKARKVTYRVPKGAKLLKWEFKLDRCKPCGEPD